ncbi:uncharacterized protein LOC141938825 isoform X2 [Strix uralensis]|uniref:uncharacterized protein LOC141938825 isoform X2 n=1 Tax=Strix uralensis TaxID=36305 RepID=UPI003DA3C296
MGGSDVSLSLRLVLAGAWAAVRSRSRGQFPRVLGLLEAVGRAAPGAVRFRHGARLRLGLQAAVVVQMLQEAQPDGKIFDAVDSFFPEGEVLAEGHGLATPQELAMVGEAQESFRELVLSLLADRGRRVAYLQGPAGEEYGERFLRALERLFYEYLQRLESALPPPDLRQLQAMVWSHAPPQPRPSDLPILSQYLMDMGHARCGHVPRPLTDTARPPEPPNRSTPSRLRPRPHLCKLHPLQFPPLDWVGDVIGDIKDETNPRRKARPLPFPRRTDSDRERDRDRHRAHGQGGADQGAGGGEGGDPPPAAAAHLQRQADERRENGGRLQDPGRLRPPSCPRPARGRGPRLTSRLAISPAQEGAGRPLPDPTPSELPSPARSPI